MKLVAAAVILQNRQVLLTRRGPSERLAGYWEFPGGKVENGESLADCLKRELNEELGVSAKVFEPLAETEYHYDHGSFRLIGLKAEIISGHIQLHVHDRAEWVPVVELLSYHLAPADIPIAEKIIAMFGG